MATITNYFEQAQLSLAAYAVDLQVGMSGSSQTAAAYIDKLTFAGMTATQAADFASTYTVLAQSTPTANGFLATLFLDNRTGQKTLAIRGTDSVTGYLTDFVDVAVLGATFAQEQYASLNSFYRQLTTQGLLTPSETFSLAGHSLGGFLAQTFSVDHLLNVAQTYTYNAPGIGGVIAEVLSWMGVTSGNVVASNITNVQASGFSTTAGLGTLLGNVQVIFTEVQNNPLNNHKLGFLTDSLAVYNLFAQLDSALNTATNGLQTITTLLKASSNVAANTLESVIADLGKLLQVTGAAGFNANEFDSSPSGRELLHTALKDITAALPAGGVTRLVATDASTLTNAQANTPDAVAYRYAFVTGNPFVLLGANYSAHNTAGELDLYDSATGLGQLTERYLKDRSAYLTAKLRDNTVDSVSNTLKDVRYNDLDTNTILTPINTELRKVTFGSAADEGISGGNGNDSLYGGAGNDTLDGGAGNDYLEGGVGLDTYYVGNGNDNLLDSDGQGSIYMGTELLNGGLMQGGNTHFKSADGKHNYSIVSGDMNTAAGATLIVDGNLTIEHYKNGSLGIVLDDTQQAPQPTASPLGADGQTPLTAYNTLNSLTPMYETVSLTQYNDRVWGQANGINLFQGLGGDDQLSAEDITNTDIATLIRNGNTQANSAQAGFLLYGNTGNDTLVGSARRDELYGGTGQDLLIGGAGNDYIEGDAEFILHAPALNAQDATPATGASDTLYAGNGDDTASGGQGNDVVYGEGGNDILYGDAMNDSEWRVAA